MDYLLIIISFLDPSSCGAVSSGTIKRKEVAEKSRYVTIRVIPVSSRFFLLSSPPLMKPLAFLITTRSTWKMQRRWRQGKPLSSLIFNYDNRGQPVAAIVMVMGLVMTVTFVDHCCARRTNLIIAIFTPRKILFQVLFIEIEFVRLKQ